MKRFVNLGYALVFVSVLPAAQAQNREPAMAKKPPPQVTTTTQQAADAKKREGKTGTSNENAAKRLKELEEQEKATYAPKSTDKKK